MSTEPRPDLLVGRKLPACALWEQLQRRAQPLALEFCSAFLNGAMTYKQARKWLEEYGIKASQTAVQAFYNSMDMRLRYASLQAAQSAEAARTELPADIDKATRDRIAQHKFELSFMNLGESQRLQLIQIQQNEDGMKGNYELKKAKLDLDRAKFEFNAAQAALKIWPSIKQISADKTLSQADKVNAVRQKLFAVLPK
jgi:hypothetical protein